MSHDLNPQHLPNPPQRSGRHLRASGHEHSAKENCKPAISFQYLQVVPMVAIFLTMVPLLWIIAIVL